MTKNLYIGNLPWSTTEDELIEAFQPHGPVVSARIITDAATGKSKGFGFVECEDNDADKFIKLMNGTTFGNRQIVVNEAKPKKGA
jgi:RNA recognition motif-containing protein